jgi:cytochrome b561
MSKFERRRLIARLAIILLAIALLVVVVLDKPEQTTAQAIAAGIAVLCVLVQRLNWRCPNCGLPPSAVPWAAPTQCRRCDEPLA